jgi:O-succinylbenzoic acid--CoA ligase
MVVAIYVPQSDQQDSQVLSEQVKSHLAAPKCPKHWFPVDDLRRSPLGKINYQFWQNWGESKFRQ